MGRRTRSEISVTDKIHICAACAFEYEQPGINGPDFHQLPDDWQCPECGIDKFMFHHYDCDDMVAEMTGKFGPHQPFATIMLEHHLL